MPTARELLEQADALMRRNRGAGVDIPVLTEVVPEPLASTEALPEIPVLTDQVEEVFVDAVPLPVQPPALELVRGPMLEGDPSDWLVMDTIDPALHSVTGKAPDTLAVVPPVTLKAVETMVAADLPRSPVTLRAAGSEPTPPPAGSGVLPPSEPIAVETLLAEAPWTHAAVVEAPVADAPVAEAPAAEAPVAEAPVEPPEVATPAPETSSAEQRADETSTTETATGETLQPPDRPAALPAPSDDERWRTLADQISMQVLQRIDLFTDTGLKEQLAQHLQPIVARAGTELVSAINDHVGKLLRAYVAEAIEREIAQWRRDHD